MSTDPPASAGGADLTSLSWGDLGQFKQAGSFPSDYPPDTLTFYSPRDPGVHQVILWTLLQAKQSIVVNMYGFDDDDAAAIINKATQNPDMYVQVSLDKSQAGGKHEKDILSTFNHDEIGNSIAIGHSIKGAISHLKLMVVDGLYMIDGSTNWSASGEQKQDNQLTLSRDRARCTEARVIADLNHDAMLQQMVKNSTPQNT